MDYSDSIYLDHLLTGVDLSSLRNVEIRMSSEKIGAIIDLKNSSKTSGLIGLPALVNAHDHARLVRLSQVDSFDVPLEAWLPYLSLIPAVDPWLASVVSFGRSAMGGSGTVMAHYTRVQGITDFITEAKAVAKAARDVGIRVALAVHCRDINPLVYDDHNSILDTLSSNSLDCVRRRFLKPALPAREQVALVEAVAKDIEGDAVTVQYGPAGVQWCSDAMLRDIAEHSAASNRRVHMHLLETRYQRIWADKKFPQGIVNYLDEIGLLNERISLAHCIYLRPDEMELIAERGATIVTNTSSNLIVSSGVAPVAEMIRRGCRVAMGLDGLSFDEDEDALREMRLGYMLHKAHGFERKISRKDWFDVVGRNGYFAVTGSLHGGVVDVGAPADLLVLDWGQLAKDLIEPDVAPLGLLLARGTKSYIHDLYVAGKKIVSGGNLHTLNLPEMEHELLLQLRSAYSSTADIRSAMPELGSALSEHYKSAYYCC